MPRVTFAFEVNGTVYEIEGDYHYPQPSSLYSPPVHEEFELLVVTYTNSKGVQRTLSCDDRSLFETRFYDLLCAKAYRVLKEREFECNLAKVEALAEFRRECYWD